MPDSKRIGIMALLESPDSESIREGAYLAGQERLEEAVPLLVDHIQGKDIGVQEAGERALRRIASSSVVEQIIPLLRADDAPLRNLAMDILREVGASNMPALCDLLEDDDPDIRIFSSDILGSTGSAMAIAPLCSALLQDPEVNVRYQAAVSLGSLAFPEAANALSSALADEEWVQYAVVEALTKIRAETSVTALINALEHSSELVSAMIVDALGEMGNLKAAPMLMRRLDDTSGPLRNKIAAAVVKILDSRVSLLGTADKDKLHTYLMIALQDDDVSVRDIAVRGLAATGQPGASEAIFNLTLELDPDRDHERMLRYVEALGSIGFNEDVARLMRQSGELGALIGVEVCSRSPGRLGIDCMKNMFEESSRDVQRALINELATQGGQEDLPFFLEILTSHQDGTVLKAVLHFLGNSGEREASLFVVPLLSHPFDDVKEAAVDACIKLGGQEVVRHLRDLAGSDVPSQRMMSVYALGEIHDPEHVPILESGLEDEEPLVRKLALEALGKIRPLSEGQLEKIGKMANDRSSEVRLALVNLVGSMEGEKADQFLIRGLDDADPWVCARCMEYLGRRRVGTAVPRLVELLDSENALLTLKAIDSLTRVGGETAFRALLSLVNHENSDIALAAEEAVERLDIAGEE